MRFARELSLSSVPTKWNGYLTRIQEFGTGIILTSQGIPFLSEGDEFLCNKDGDSNSFNVEVPNIIQWNLRVAHEDVFDDFKNTIALRRTHRAFRLTSWEEVNRNLETTPPCGDVSQHQRSGLFRGNQWLKVSLQS